MKNYLLELDNISKSYPKTHRARDRVKALIKILLGKPDLGGSAVLSDISLRVAPGESMAVIGENGAGKSTLLKVLTGVLRPTTGEVSTNTSMAALLELGAGFQPEFTGLENIRIKATLLGLSRKELKGKLDQILDFADIGEYIHEPVKHYSSGMVVRLGFAVITAVNPQLLVTDEILAVGDESFQKKCISWIEKYLERGGTLLMVSHNMFQVQKLCKHACWIHQGRMEKQGDVFDVTQAYLAHHERKDLDARRAGRNAAGGGSYRITGFSLSSATEQPEPVIETGDGITANLELKSADGRAPIALFGVVRADGTPVYGISSDQANASPIETDPGCYRYQVCFRDLPLLPGSYSLRAHAMDPEGVRLFDTREERFTVRGSTRELGFVKLDTEWPDQFGAEHDHREESQMLTSLEPASQDDPEA